MKKIAILLTMSFILPIISLTLTVSAPTTYDVAPNTETVTLGTTGTFSNLLLDDNNFYTIVEGGSGGPATDNWYPSSQSIGPGTQSGGSFPTDVQTTNDIRTQYQEGNVGGPPDTTLQADVETLTSGTKVSGTFPTDINTNNGVPITYREVNTVGSQTLAYDTSIEAVRTLTTDPFTWTHTPIGTPRGVIVTTAHGIESTNCIVSVTYGSATMTITQSNTDTLTEPGRSYIYFVGTSIPTGPQTVTADIAALGTCSTTDMEFVSITYTAAVDTVVLANNGINENVANPSVTLSYSGRQALAVMVFYSGVGTVPITSACSGSSACTLVFNEDLGNFVSTVDRQTTRGGTNQVMGYTSGTDNVAFSAVAITQTNSANNYILSIKYDWTSETCTAATKILEVNAWHTDSENTLVQVVDSTEVTWTTQIIVSQTTDTATQTYTLTPDEWDSGNPNIRFIGATESGDITQTDTIVDLADILCDQAPPEYTVGLKYSWTGIPTGGTEYRLFVEGRRETNPENINICIWSADELSCNDSASLTIATDVDVMNNVVLTVNQFDTGTPDISFSDATPTDTAQSTFGLDWVRIQRTYSTTTYDALVQHDWTATIPLSDSYQLRVRAYRSGTENWLLQTWDWQDSIWTTRITVSSGTETLYTYSLTSACTGSAGDCERNSGSSVRARWITESSSDTVQDTLTIDQEIIQRTDQDPTLTSPTITPSTGDSTTDFDFSVVYTDVVTCPATYVRVTIDGGAADALTETVPGDIICIDGKAYDLQPDRSGFCPNPAHTYFFTGSDGVNIEVRNPPAGTLTWAVTNIVPSISNGGGAPTTVVHGAFYSYDFDATDNDVSLGCQSFIWSMPVGPGWLSIEPASGILSGTAPHTTGPNSVTVRVSDGTATNDYPYTVTVIDNGPVITNGGGAPLTVNHGLTYSYDFNATDSDGDPLVWSCPVCPGWLTIDPDTGVLSGTAPHTTGPNAVNITVEDNAIPAGFDWFNYTVTVIDTSPEITNKIVVDLGQEGVPYSHDWNATDADSDPLLWECVVCRTWMNMNDITGTLTGIPDESGIWTIEIQVCDNADPIECDSDSYELTINATPFQFTSSPITSITMFDFYEYQATTNKDPANYSLDEAPLWLHINGTSGLIYGTPSLGIFNVSIRAVKGTQTIWQNYTLEVNTMSADMLGLIVGLILFVVFLVVGFATRKAIVIFLGGIACILDGVQSAIIGLNVIWTFFFIGVGIIIIIIALIYGE